MSSRKIQKVENVTTKKYRVSTSLSDYDFENAYEARIKFEKLQETASLWKRHINRMGLNSWIGIKWKRYKNKRNQFFDYNN